MDKTTVPSGTSPPPLPAGGNAHDDVSAFASAMMSSQPSSDEPKVVAAIDPTYSATAADVLPASDHECANCGNLANKRCTGCDRGVEINGDKSSPTYYCSKDCQRDHRKTHEFHCKLAIDRSQLFRIGRLVQWAFYESIKAMWSDGILDVEKVEDTDRVELRVQRCQKHDLPDFPSFPESGFTGYGGGVLEEGDEKAVLAASARNPHVVCWFLDELMKG
jgi:hypothetical protein